MHPAASVLPTDTIVHVSRGSTYVAPAAQVTYDAPAATSIYTAPAGGVSETAIHGLGVGVNARG